MDFNRPYTYFLLHRPQSQSISHDQRLCAMQAQGNVVRNLVVKEIHTTVYAHVLIYRG